MTKVAPQSGDIVPASQKEPETARAQGHQRDQRQTKYLKEVLDKADIGDNIEKFRNQLLFAVTSSIWCIMATLPLWIPEWSEKMPEKLQGGGGWAALVMLFTLSPDLAHVVQNIWQCLLGVILAWCNIFFVDAVLGGNSPSDGAQEFFLWVDYIFVTMFILYFSGLGGRARLLGLHFTSAIIMTVMNPAKDIDYTDMGVKFILQTCWGSAAAVCAVLLPRPRLARYECKTVLLKIVDRIEVEFTLAGDYYALGKTNPMIYKLKDNLEELALAVANSKASLGIAWWEGLDLGTFGRSRSMMLRVNALCGRLWDILYAIEVAITEGFGPDHEKAVETIGPACVRLRAATGKLLHGLAMFAVDGRIDNDEAAKLKKLQQIVRETQHDLLEATRKLGNDEKMQSVWSYAWSLTCYAQKTIDGTTEILQNPAVDGTPIAVASASWKALATKPTMERLSNMVVTTIMIVIGFIIGKNVFKMSSGIAVNIGWLISPHLGSTMKKDLQRIIGVALPYTLGSVIYMNYSACSEGDHAVRAICLFLIEIACIYSTNSNKEYGYIALLMSVFSPLVLLQPCDDSSSEIAIESATYKKIRDIVLAVCMLIALNVVGFSAAGRMGGFLKPASMMTKESLNASLKLLENGFNSFLTKQLNQKSHIVPLQGVLGKLQGLNNDAKGEPRLYKRPWPGTLVDDILVAMRHLRLNLSTLLELEKDILPNHDNSGSLGALEQFQTEVAQSLQLTRALVNCIMLRKEEEQKDDDEEASLESVIIDIELQTIGHLVTALKEEVQTERESAAATLLESSEAQLCVMVSTFQNMSVQIQSIYRGVLRVA